jgi:hypothetical protein
MIHEDPLFCQTNGYHCERSNAMDLHKRLTSGSLCAELAGIDFNDHSPRSGSSGQAASKKIIYRKTVPLLSKCKEKIMHAH